MKHPRLWPIPASPVPAEAMALDAMHMKHPRLWPIPASPVPAEAMAIDALQSLPKDKRNAIILLALAGYSEIELDNLSNIVGRMAHAKGRME